uniref:Uncharacterized protein n=1 Tax=Sipha flava TaxID=143950 RepID=A0A2S2QI19_9HEMI
MLRNRTSRKTGAEHVYSPCGLRSFDARFVATSMVSSSTCSWLLRTRSEILGQTLFFLLQREPEDEPSALLFERVIPVGINTASTSASAIFFVRFMCIISCPQLFKEKCKNKIKKRHRSYVREGNRLTDDVHKSYARTRL